MYIEETQVPPETLELIREGSSLLRKIRNDIAEENRWEVLTEYSDGRLITLDRVLRFWCMDGIIRLAGVPGNPNRKGLLKEANGLAARFDFLARLLLHSGDYESVVDLIAIRHGWKAARREILRRYEQRKFGKEFRHYLNTKGFAVGDLLDVTASQIRAWLRKGKIPIEKSPRTKDLLESLKMPLVLSSIEANEVLKKFSRKYEMLEDDRSEVLVTIHEHYDKLKKAVEWAVETDSSLDNIPPSPIMERRPLEKPLWERKLRQRMLRDIQKMVKKYLPILDGRMENAPLKVYDRHRTRVRQELRREENTISWDELDDEEHYGNGDEGFLLSKKVVGIADPEERADVINAKEKFDELLELELKNVNPPRKRAQVREAMHLVVYEDRTVKEAAKIKNVCEKTLRKYKQKIGI